MDGDSKTKGGREVDSISSLPDVILQHILSFIPTEFAIRTSLLSRRWKHVWCDTPSLSFHDGTVEAASIYKTQTRYTAPKMMSLHLGTDTIHYVPHINMWIELAMSRNVEKMSLEFPFHGNYIYNFPDFFYTSFSVKELTLKLSCTKINPRFRVSWTSLNKLSLYRCILSDENMAKILSGCPVLETLVLHHCRFRVLDLTKSPRLRALKIVSDGWVRGPTQIVAPHIYCLRLTAVNFNLPYTLVDVSSLNEAILNICFWSTETLKADFLQVKVLEMLEKLQNVEKLTLGGNFLQILSLAELCRVPVPMFKVKALTLETHIFQYVIPGIERVLQNSPDLEKLTIHPSHYNTIKGSYLDKHLILRGINPDQCWRSKDGILWNKSLLDLESKHVASFIEFMLKNAKALKNMVVFLEDKFKELAPTLPRNNNVSIVLSTRPTTLDEW